MITGNTVAAGISTLVLALTFVVGGRLRPVQRLIRDQGWTLSTGAGVSIAYVFVHMMPELAGAREVYAREARVPVMFKGMLVYFVAMIGFMAYYGLEIVRRRIRQEHKDGKMHVEYWTHLGGFAAYVCMITYMLINRIERTDLAITLYTVAMVTHFLSIDHSLRSEHGAMYERSGRDVLAAMCALGWLIGLFLPMPLYLLALMLAFVSGSIIMNSAIMELPSRREEKYLGFLTGGLIYGVLLIPLGAL